MRAASIESEYQVHGEMFNGHLYAQAHDEHDQEWNLLFLAFFVGWMTEGTPSTEPFTPSIRPVRRVERFVHEQASQYHPEVLAKDLVAALEQEAFAGTPYGWLGTGMKTSVARREINTSRCDNCGTAGVLSVRDSRIRVPRGLRHS
jgi:hypothetical protein